MAGSLTIQWLVKYFLLSLCELGDYHFVYNTHWYFILSAGNISEEIETTYI